MTRPEIIRADTLDLQDKTSPTAADHSASLHPAPLGVGPAAPHQQATLRQVEDERSTQEKGIWESKGLRDEPGSDDEMAGDEDNSARLLNGGIGGDGNDAEVVDGEDDDYDDMDRISSSPSISDEGRYSLPSYYQNSSEQAPSSVEGTPIASSSPTCVSSSPFTDTPVHMPLSVAAARRSPRIPAGGADPASSPLLFPPPTKIKSEVHHHGEYWTRTTKGPPDQVVDGQLCEPSPRTQRLTEVETRFQDMHSSSTSSMFSDVDEFLTRSMLQPISGPMEQALDDPFTDKPTRSSTLTSEDKEESDASEPGHLLLGPSLDDDDSWTTDSDIDSVEFEDDEPTDITFSDDPRFVDFGFGGECLQELADIDFQSVYALHTFVATVEGQANATKGDTMVLLDDSNSYWWLVRVVKDSSIGYLPAEHIETPTERLARLNKHRNIDLSATMLGDTAEKTKNPLKKAMRRRNAKTVQFGPPEYVEASDYDYSSDEGGDEELFGGADPNQAQAQQQQQQQQASSDKSNEAEQEDGMKVQPLKVNGAKKETGTNAETEGKEAGEETGKSDGRPSNEVSEQPLDPKVSRNGTMRNTDSFFKDDSAETRKITLTPNLLRDDSSTSTTGSRERGPSLESLEKTGFADKVKDKEKKKEKKPGMLSGLFKRKDKKAKGALESFDSDTEKQSDEFGRNSPQSRPDDGTSSERPSTDQPSPQRQPSKGKLQKPQRANSDAPIRTKSILKTDSPEPSIVQTTTAKDPSGKPASQATSTMRLVASDAEEVAKPSTEASGSPPEGNSRSNSAASKLNPVTVMKAPQDTESKPEKVRKAKQRVQLDDFDSDEDQKDPFSDPEVRTHTGQRNEPDPSGRLSESPVHVSAADAQPLEKEGGHEKDHESDSHPPGLTGDDSSQDTSSPISTPTPDDNPSTAQPTKSEPSSSQPTTSAPPKQSTPPATLPLTIPQPSRPAPTPKEIGASPPDSSESASLPAWSDSSLRNYLDDGSDIRDMLLVINDTTGVVPVSADHPIMARFCVEEQKTMSALSNELDSMLNGLLEKRLKRSKSASPSALRAGR